MKTRIVHTSFWEDSYISELSRNEKLLFIYLLTNPKINICGSYELPLRKVTFDTGLTREEAERALAKFEAAGKVIYRSGWVRVKNIDKYNSYLGDKNEKAKAKELAVVPSSLLDDTSIDTSMGGVSVQNDTLRNQKSEIRNQKKGESEGELEEWIATFNTAQGSNFKAIPGLLPNFVHWRKFYSLDELKQALLEIPRHEWLRDKAKPELLLRQSDTKNNSVDRIGELLALYQKLKHEKKIPLTTIGDRKFYTNAEYEAFLGQQ